MLDAVGHGFAGFAVIVAVLFIPCVALGLMSNWAQKRDNRIAQERWTRENLARHTASNKSMAIEYLRRRNGFFSRTPRWAKTLDALVAEGRIEKIGDDHYRILEGHPLNAEIERLDFMRSQ